MLLDGRHDHSRRVFNVLLGKQTAVQAVLRERNRLPYQGEVEEEGGWTQSTPYEHVTSKLGTVTHAKSYRVQYIGG